ncbi:MAG: protein kinase [Acidobacteriota bacterium]
MKRCPVCLTTYQDSSIFCALDAQALVNMVTTERESLAGQPPSLSSQDEYMGKLLSNKFRIDAVLGRGGMGAVYRATDIALDRVVAVKLLHPDLVGDENLDIRFVREARAAARIEHPNAITVHDFGTLPEGGAFIVMEFIQGCALRDLIKRNGPVSSIRAVELMRQACSAVAAAHQAGVIHRDLKPENIMLKEVGIEQTIVKVVDFGLAKLKESSSPSVANLTSRGEIIGTPYYMSPEQCAGGEIDERTDIYSLGIIFYEILIGKPPFQGTPAAVIGMHLYKAIPSLSEQNPEIPAALEEVILSMLQKKKEKRPESLGTVLRRLESWQNVAPLTVMAPAILQLHPQVSAKPSDVPTQLEGFTEEVISPAPSYQQTPQQAETLRRDTHLSDPERITPKAAQLTQSTSQPLLNENNGSEPTIAIDSTAPSTQCLQDLPTQEQQMQTVIYNSLDFQTRRSEPLNSYEPARFVPTDALTNYRGQVAPSGIIPPTQVVLSPPQENYRKLYLIGILGLIVGLIIALVFIPSPMPVQPAAPMPTVASPPSVNQTIPPPSTNASEAIPVETVPTVQPSKTPVRQERRISSKRERNTDTKDIDKAETDNKNNGGFFRRVAGGFKRVITGGNGKKAEKRRERRSDD